MTITVFEKSPIRADPRNPRSQIKMAIDVDSLYGGEGFDAGVGMGDDGSCAGCKAEGPRWESIPKVRSEVRLIYVSEIAENYGPVAAF